MTKFSDLTMADINGATLQWAAYVKDVLGFDDAISAKITVESGKGEAWVTASDKFQSATDYSKKIGRCGVLVNFKFNDDWDKICKQVWAGLEKVMKRDERELRHGLQTMGGIIEQSESYTSLVGKMFADRILKARDEATNHMIEHHGWKAA